MALSLAVVFDEVGVGDIRSNNVKVLVIGSEYAKKAAKDDFSFLGGVT